MGQGMGPGMMGPGMMGPGMMGQGMGPGMMGQGMGPGMMGPGMMGQGMGPGMMGPGMMGQGMGPGMMGPGMMGQGMGPGMMGPGGMAALPKDLSVDEVRHMLGHQLTSQGNPNLKLGKVEEKDADTIVAEIVTTDGAIVQRFQINRHTGWMQSTQ
jgi:hypothetical protein